MNQKLSPTYKLKPNQKTSLILMRKIAGQNIEVRVGDVVVTPRGKTAVVTGWDEVNGIVHTQTTCEQRYFMSVPANFFNCWFAEA